jgi:hypothetical protein
VIKELRLPCIPSSVKSKQIIIRRGEQCLEVRGGLQRKTIELAAKEMCVDSKVTLGQVSRDGL